MEEDVEIDIPFAPGVDEDSDSDDTPVTDEEDEDDVPLGVVEDEDEEDIDVDIPFAEPTVTGDKTSNKMWLWSAVSVAAATVTGKMASSKKKAATEGPDVDSIKATDKEEDNTK